ncbi:neural cell adhesion molecule 2-like [Oculina patagonica]
MATRHELLPFIHVLILVSSFIKASVAAEAVNWTAKPKDSEYFVGREAIFQWEYSSPSPDAVQFIKFGIVADGDDVVLINKDMFQKVVRFNTEEKRNVTSSLNGRVTALKNQTASFKITNLKMDDSGKYFCFLEPQNPVALTISDYVRIKVVDIIIDRKNSTEVIESWEGHKITLKCAVRKAFPNSTVRFYWSRSEELLPGKQVDWKDMSQMTIVTETDSQFDPVTCTAKTESSTQTLDIIIKRLYKPSEPINVTIQETHSNNTECPMYNKLTWEPPVDDGDTPITSYLVEYKHPVFNRVLISKTISRCTEHVICKLQASGYPREVHVDVRAINKVGRGFRSRTVPVSFFSSPSAPLNLTNSLVRKEQPPFDVWISWSPPEENGGSLVMQYVLEYKEHGSPWIDATIIRTNNTYISISKNEKSFVYEVRVTARNKFGFGTASKVITAYFAGILISF